MLDHNPGQLDRFIGQTERIRAVREGADAAMVVLTQTSPLILAVVVTRRRIEAAIPALRGALWVVYVEPASDPFFLEAAHELGILSGPLSTAPIWYGPGAVPFLILSPEIDDQVDLRVRASQAPIRIRA
jgi:hypothetical protein